MTNQPPLSPDALANLRLLADRATEEVRHAVIEPDILHKLLDLAVAQPEVNSVEELDALPVGSVILDGDPCVLQMVEKSSIVGSEWAIANAEHIYTTGKITLPARVLYRPEVPGA